MDARVCHDPASEHVKKSKSRQKPLPVMAVLDTAIQEKAKHFNGVLDSRVKPGHDNGERFRFSRTHAQRGATEDS
jgi:hypothetical protein